MAVPAFDFFSAIARRVVERRSPLAPDHEHLHHVLMVNGLSSQATLVFLLICAGVMAAVGVVGNAMAVPDSVMCIGWVAAGVLYYQAMRHPRPVVRIVQGLNPWAGHATRRPA
jgi:UDP-GlcNAc:undecaprenyl-phosphate GlcNAc-1-phosphate transferase